MTALLYLVSHIYTSRYLATLGVSQNFQSYGLGNLVMLTMFDVFVVAVTTAITYWLLHHKHKLWLDVALSIILAVLMGLPVITMALKGDEHPIANPVSTMFTVLLILGFARFRRPKHIAARMMLELADGNAALLTDPKAQAAHIELRERVGRMRVLLLLFCAYSSALVYVGTAAQSEALVMLDQNAKIQWKALDATSAPRVPLYTVGDRYIYATIENGVCLLHMETGSTEFARRICPTVVASYLVKTP
jgi:hypothetical protein